MVAGLLGLALVAHAAISSIQPSSGQGEPGETVSAVVRVTTSGLTSCLTATSNTTLVVTFDGLITMCGTGTWSALMEVAIPAVTPPGNYTVTVSEISVGGSLLGASSWPLQVTAPPTTTTTLLPEVTLFTTSTTPDTTTTTAATPTTSGAAATSTTSTTTTITTTDSSNSTIVIREATTSTEGDVLTYSPPPLAGGPSTSVAANTPETTGNAPRDPVAAPFSEIAVSSGLIDVADRALPPVFAQAILSPMVLIEVLLRALGRTGSGLLIPLGATILAGFALTRRLRHDGEDVPELDEMIEIPDEGEDRR